MKKEVTNWRTLLNRWINGEANRDDERSLDALAQDDPFLADALEGYRSDPGADHARAVSRLKANLRKRNEKKGRTLVFFLKRIAAVGAVLLAAWLVFRWSGVAEKETLSLNEQPETTGQTAEKAIQPTEQENTGTTPEALTGNETTNLQSETADPQRPTPPAPTSNRKARATEEKTRQAERQQSRKEEQLAMLKKENSRLAATGSAQEIAAEEAPLQKSQEASSAAEPRPLMEDSAFTLQPFDEPAADVARIVQGQVTDPSGQPLIGASVIRSGTGIGVVTDVEGLFTIEVPAENPSLTIAYTGFANQEVEVADDDFLTIQLSEGVALDEVVVTGKRAKITRNNVSSSVSMIDNDALIEPRGGVEKFRKYIDKNLQKPAAAVDAGIVGQVLVSFVLDDSGRPTDFKIPRSLGYGCDEEAIRLLKEGPKWKGPSGIRRTYTVDFK